MNADGSDLHQLPKGSEAPASERNFETAGSPVWSSDGAQIAFGSATTDGEAVWLVTNADGAGDAREIDELRYLSWRGGGYFCRCYGQWRAPELPRPHPDFGSPRPRWRP